MTEEQWLACADVERMLAFLLTKNFPEAEPCNWGAGERKKRLLVVACLRRIWNSLPTEYRFLAEIIELDADGMVAVQTRRTAWEAAELVTWAHRNLLFAIGYDDIGLLCHLAAGVAAEVVADTHETTRDVEALEQSRLLRDIFGNPFRPVTFDPAWLTSTVVSLARGMYDSRDFTAMPILADALQDAGCNSDHILDHCRGPGTHVRGCWVVDLEIGKT